VAPRAEAQPLSRAQALLRAPFENALKVNWNDTRTAVDAPEWVAIGTTIGPRRERNEDRVFAASICRGTEPHDKFFIAVICDGIGGELNGEQSAWTATAAFIAECALSESNKPNDILRDGAVAANIAVHPLTRGHGGTTLIAMLINAEGKLGAVNCGDSRLYKLPVEGRLEQLSHDQTVGAAIQGIAKHATTEAVSHLSLPIGLDSELGNYIGIGADLFPELIPFENVLIKDSFILGTDGTWDALGPKFETILREATTPLEAVKRVLASVNDVGGKDNASLAIVSSVTKLLADLRQKKGEEGLISISGVTPNGRIDVSIVFLPQRATMLERVQSDAAPQRRPTKSRKKESKVRDQQAPLPLDRKNEESPEADEKRKRRPRVQVVAEKDLNGDE
jgi:PPM family protein phosphatase